MTRYRILSPEESSKDVDRSLWEYTQRTNLPPVDGVCECYTDWTGLRIPLRRPCPVHGVSSKPATIPG